jgi:1-acyl-sn-glycerol-3-phosphate acyltransferase
VCGLHEFYFRETHELLGTTSNLKNIESVPKTYQVYLFQSSSMYDIINDWYLRRFHCKFVSKKELGREFSISFNLRHGGSVLIERILNKQIPAIKVWLII